MSADKFLSKWAPKILASPAYKAGGMLMVTFDEAESVASTWTPARAAILRFRRTPRCRAVGPGGGTVGHSCLGATKPGTTDAEPYNHYSLLCSLENLFGSSTSGLRALPAWLLRQGRLQRPVSLGLVSVGSVSELGARE